MTEEEKQKLENLKTMFPNIPDNYILDILRVSGGSEDMAANMLFDF